jgi:hypothetical protein
MRNMHGLDQYETATQAEIQKSYSGCHKYVPIAIFLTDGTAMCNGLKL